MKFDNISQELLIWLKLGSILFIFLIIINILNYIYENIIIKKIKEKKEKKEKKEAEIRNKEEEIRKKEKDKKDKKEKEDKDRYVASKFSYLGGGKGKSCTRETDESRFEYNIVTGKYEYQPETTRNLAPLYFDSWGIISLNDCKEECLKNKEWCLGIERTEGNYDSFKSCRLIGEKELFEKHEGPINKGSGEQKINGKDWSAVCKGDCSGWWKPRVTNCCGERDIRENALAQHKSECYRLYL